jgi:hypothetical protein
MLRFALGSLLGLVMLSTGCQSKKHARYRQLIVGNWSGVNSAGQLTISFMDSAKVQVDYRQMGGELVNAQYRFINDSVFVITPPNDTAIIKQLTQKELLLKPYHPKYMEFVDAIFVTSFAKVPN